MLNRLFAKLGKFLQIKRNFIIYWLVCIGVPGAVGSVWWLGGYGGVGFSLFLIGAVFGGAYFSAILMWEFYAKDASKETGKKGSG
jgi:hypothetical protein